MKKLLTSSCIFFTIDFALFSKDAVLFPDDGAASAWTVADWFFDLVYSCSTEARAKPRSNGPFVVIYYEFTENQLSVTMMWTIFLFYAFVKRDALFKKKFDLGENEIKR